MCFIRITVPTRVITPPPSNWKSFRYSAITFLGYSLTIVNSLHNYNPSVIVIQGLKYLTNCIKMAAAVQIEKERPHKTLKSRYIVCVSAVGNV
jgi:hypothetical protein